MRQGRASQAVWARALFPLPSLSPSRGVPLMHMFWEGRRTSRFWGAHVSSAISIGSGYKARTSALVHRP